MCSFFSCISNPITGDIFFFDAETRKQLYRDNPKGYVFDSHSSISDYFGYTPDKEDLLNKYEYCPITKIFKIDQINSKINDSAKVKYFCEHYDFTAMLEDGNYSLDLRSLTLIPEGLVLPETLNGSLYLSSITSIPEGLEKKYNIVRL